MENLQEILQNPKIFKINRLDAHSDHEFYSNIMDMQEDNKSLHYNLNGMWKYKYSENIYERPSNFYKDNYDLSNFDEIAVPSHIELNGYDDIHYVNTMYPWDGKCFLRPPYLDFKSNSVSSYVCNFDLPETFIGKKVCINFNGVEQAFNLWINGEYIGYAEDSFTPSHFELTKYIKNTNNRLCVEVYKRSAAAWLEDQDFFRFSGIFRDVVLYAKPKIHIEDIWAISEVEDNLKYAKLKLKLKISGSTSPNVNCKIYDAKNNIVIDSDLKLNFESKPVVENCENADDYFVSQQIALQNVDLWDINTPSLYKTVLSVYDESNQIVEVATQDIGFRKFEIKNKVMMLNGKRLIINGVNRHEWNPKTGRAITQKDMLADLEILKRNNITAVRTSHYPNNSYWYKLCDENGIILMDETNLESHGSWQKMAKVDPEWNVPGSDEKWHDIVIDRAVSMFERDKNHPSILWWSCGNESYAEENILAMADYFRRKDNSRVVHYESCFHNRAYDKISDVESRMYAYPKEIEEYFENNAQKPYLLCEYMHVMGNSLGGMESYINLLDKYDGFQGGFIWDFKDQAIYKSVNGKQVLCYGGDFNDRPTDYNFSANGIVFSDGIEKPAMQDVRFWYKSKEERQKHTAHNEEQIKLLKPTKFHHKPSTFEIIHGDVNIGVKGENFYVMFSKTRGGIVSLKYFDKEWIYRETKPTYFRATTENDNASLEKGAYTATANKWIVCELYSKAKDMQIVTDLENEVTVKYIFDTLMGNDVTVNYTVYSDGQIKVSTIFKGDDNLPTLPLFGMKFIIPETIKKYEYIGYSGETYPDRYKGGVFARHKEKVQIPSYLVPQECGGHYQNYMLKLKADDNNELVFTAAEDKFGFSVLPNSATELENALHKYELPESERTYVNILARMRGVGGINSWGADVEPNYTINTNEDIKLEFYISANEN